MTVSVAELSLHLAEYLARVQAGETIFVEDQDHVLAKIAPVGEGTDVDREEIAELVRRGVVRAPVEPLSMEETDTLLAQITGGTPGPDMVAALPADREEGR